MTALILHYAPDNASLCVRLALEACGLPYRTALVDRMEHGQDTAVYRRLNPHGLIPALETPQGPIFETAAILLWLSEQAPGAQLMPATQDPDRAAALAWLFWLSNTLHPSLRMLFYPQKYIQGDSTAFEASTKAGLISLFDRLEVAAAAVPSWLAPGAASAHICYLCPMLRWPALYPAAGPRWYDLTRWPHLSQIAKVTEASPWALAATSSEGLGNTPFSNPHLPNPPEGSAI